MGRRGASNLHCAALALAAFPGAALAALDDHGMQYVTAAEGLHGSLRVDILQVDSTTTTSGGEDQSLRLWVRGSAALGGRYLQSTHYYWELRGDGASVTTHAFELGLAGPFGNVTFGQLDMVAPRLVPVADLNLLGRDNNPAALASEPGSNSLRYETPTYQGFLFGASARLADQPGADPTVDEYSLAARLHLGASLKLGAGYEVEACWRPLQGAPCLPERQTNRRGWRAGIHYTHARWQLAYEHRAYTAFEAFEVGSAIGIPFRPGTDTRLTTLPASLPLPTVGTGLSLDHYPGHGYRLHALGVQGHWKRLTATASYNTEELDIPPLGIFFTSPNPAVVSFRFLAPAASLRRKTLGLELAYTLGGRATLAVGGQRVRKDELAVQGSTAANAATVLASTTTTTTYLIYRVDF